jgi:hypothetical protein
MKSLDDSKDVLKSSSGISPALIKDIRDEYKSIKAKVKHLGLEKPYREMHKTEDAYTSAKDDYGVLSLQIKDLEKTGLTKQDPELRKLLKQRSKESLNLLDLEQQAKRSKVEYYDQVYKTYRRIAGEQEAVSTMDRLKLSAKMRKESPPFERVGEDPVLMSRVNSGEMATTGAIGSIYNGVDWDEYEETGDIYIDPEKAFRGLLLGMATGVGMKVLPKAADKWTEVTKRKLFDTPIDIIKGSITNETLRQNFRLDNNPQLAKMIDDYQKKSNLVLKKALAIGREINTLAPTQLQQKRLTRILEGGVTADPSLAKKAHSINAMFKDLKESTRALNLSHYSRFDELTRKQRADLRRIIKNPDTPSGEREVAQKMMDQHYHIGSAKEYLPIFKPSAEGLTKMEKQSIKDEIRNLKKKVRTAGPEDTQEINSQIAELEKFVVKNAKKKKGFNGPTLDQGYAIMRQDLPSEVTRTMNTIMGPAYRTAKGAAAQGTDVLKARLLNHISENPEWALPRSQNYSKPPANYTMLSGKQWGPLENKYVRKDVISDLDEVVEMRTNLEKNIDKILGYWKYGKAILNPATHAKNFTSNATMAYFAGVNPADVSTYAAASNALKQGVKSQVFNEADAAGLYRNTFFESNFNDLRDELASIKDKPGLSQWIRKAVNVPSMMYDQSEKFFKTAVYINARQEGMNPDEAVKQAEKFLFNYQDIPPAVKHYKRWAAPFVTYSYKAAPVLAEMMITKPWKIGAVFAMGFGIEKLAMDRLSLTDEDVETDKNAMFESRGKILLPSIQDDGTRIYGNLGDFMPWSGVGRSWGRSNIPLADFMPSNPLFTTAAAIMTNKESFTGNEIYNEVLDSTSEMVEKYLKFAWKQLMPSLAPGGYASDKMVEAFKNSMGAELKDYTGEAKDPSTLVARALLGLKLTKSNEDLINRFSNYKARTIMEKVRERRYDIIKQRKNNYLTDEETEKQLDELRLLQKNLQQKL